MSRRHIVAIHVNGLAARGHDFFPKAAFIPADIDGERAFRPGNSTLYGDSEHHGLTSLKHACKPSRRWNRQTQRG
jgi:hypothetical protein